MFFALAPKSALLTDINPDLITCYRAVRDSPKEVARLLRAHHKLHSHDHYYKMRSEKPNEPAKLAAWLIYLNRTCWNGLYRVNSRNQFNVPMGSKTSVLLDTDDFVAVSQLLSSVQIEPWDFERSLSIASAGDFVFVDPPYTVKHNTNGFLKYNDKLFSWADQVRLRDAVHSASKRGALILVTNANHDSIRELYDGVGHIQEVRRQSVLAASATHRTETSEIVVTTWKSR